MKLNIKYILVVLLPIFLLNNINAQSFIGNYEVYESNGDYYLETGTNDVRINENAIIIEYQTGTLKTAIQSFEQTKNLQLKSIVNNYYIYFLPNNANYITYCQDIEQSTIVEYIEVSVYFTFSSGLEPDDDEIDEQYYLGLLEVYDAWGITTGDNDVIVGVLDSGLEFDDEEFGPDVTNVSNLFMNANDPWTDWDNPNSGDTADNDMNGYKNDYIGWDFYNNDNDVTPGGNLWHGSLVAGIIAEKTNNGEEQTCWHCRRELCK